MKKKLHVDIKDQVVLQADRICYWQRQDWCEGRYRQLNFSLMKPRCHYAYDKDETYPLILWITGGSFIEEDINIWMPDLVYYVKYGYAVAGVDYSINGRTHFPMGLEDIKACIRYIRAHAKDLHIDPDRIGIMGESAGGYYTALTALTSNTSKYDKGDFLEYSSSVRCAVPWYTPCKMKQLEDLPEQEIARFLDEYPDLDTLVYPDAPPMMLLHGTADELVPYHESELLYEALTNCGAKADLYLVEGANHADHHFIQESTKELILDFFDKNLKA